MPESAIFREAGSGALNTAFDLPRRIVLTPEETGGAFVLFDETIPKDHGPLLHVHHKEHEMFEVLSGRILFRAGQDDILAGPGDTVLIPPGLPHTFKGLSDPPAVARIMLTPGRAGDFFKVVQNEGLVPPDDMARIREVAALYNMEFVGPPLE